MPASIRDIERHLIPFTHPMTTDPLSPNIRYVSQVDGQDADAAALAPLAFAGYAHFTAL